MKANKIVAGLLIVLGFGGCANRAAKSKTANGADGQGQTEIKAETDSVAPIRVMYGPPRPRIQPERRLREVESPEQAAGTSADTTAGATPPQEQPTE